MSKNIFLIETVQRNQKAMRHVSKWAQTPNDWEEFSNSKERNRKKFLLFNFVKNDFRIYYESIMLFSIYWSHRDEENLERAMRIALAACSEKYFLDNEALTRWKRTWLQSFSNNQNVYIYVLLNLKWADGDDFYRLKKTTFKSYHTIK